MMTVQMPSTESRGTTAGISKAPRWAGRILSALASLFCVFDGAMKLVKPPAVVQATLQLGYQESAIVGIGVTLLVCTVLYTVPRTAALGAVLLTGYLGGAVASNVRAGMPLFNTIFPIMVASLLWGGLWLRDLRVRGLLSK